jgi:serine/threonine protein kinase
LFLQFSYTLTDESRQHDWDTRYQLIKGICRGLQYLHNKERINHLDLKPANILLDADMAPKITDFGLSRRFSGEQSRIITEHVRGTP